MNDYLNRRMRHILSDRPPKEKKKYFLNKKSPKTVEREKKSNERRGETGLDIWFDWWMAHAEPVCDNCGLRADWLLEPKYASMWRACQAHVLPKKDHGFPSLSCVIENHLVLFPSWGGHLCGCHATFDSSWDNAVKMNVWHKAKEIIKVLLPMASEKEKKTKLYSIIETLLQR